MRTWGAECVPSPSSETAAGRAILAEDPRSPGSLGIAISEAVEAAVTDPTGRTRYTLGSVLNHVLLHQTIIGLEAQEQLASIGETKVDTIIGCVGGGSNFAGLSFPFVREKIHGAQIDIIAVEPASCPTLTRGPLRLRSRRRGPHDPPAAHAQPGPHLHAPRHPRGRPALPRHGAPGEPDRGGRA